MNMNEVKFAMTPGFYINEELGEAFFREIAENGFDAMELCIYPRHFAATDARTREIKKLCEDYSIAIESLHCDFDVLNAKRINEAEAIICSNLELTTELGGEFLIIHSSLFAAPDNILVDKDGNRCPGNSVFRDILDPETGMLNRVKEGMAFYAERAKALGVVIALETDWKMNDRLLDFISEADETACGICFDTGHANLLNAPEMLYIMGRRVITTHIHDNHGLSDEHLFPFQGNIDWEAFLLELMKAGYNGSFTFECLKGTMEDIVEARAKFVELLNKKA